MLVKRFYDEKLAQASYLLGCAATGQALVVDPNRNIDVYLEAAAEEDLQITHVTETHIHADFLSGSRELAARTGAKLYLSDEGDENWKYGFAESSGAKLVKDGDHFTVGNIRIDIKHTPGHTPEHLSFLVTDTKTANEPIGILSGDFVFVGDVGRPDLLERAAGVSGTMVDAAKLLYQSLQWFKGLPDFLQVWPAHGAGSACGKALGAIASSTVGYEKRFNWALQVTDEATFVQAVLEGQPEPPFYFAKMKHLNKVGPALLNGYKLPPQHSEAELHLLLQQGAQIVDLRSPMAYGGGFIPGSLNIPGSSRNFPTWSGWLLSYDLPIYLIAAEEQGHAVMNAVKDLSLIGLDQVYGWFGPQLFDHWSDNQAELAQIPSITTEEVAQAIARDEVTVIDVRNLGEWKDGHIAEALHIQLGYLPRKLDQLSRDKAIAVHCETGPRAIIAAGLLKSHGFHHVSMIRGGFARWKADKLPIAYPEAKVLQSV